MSSFLQRFQPLAGVALPALMLVLSANSPANAQSANDAEVKALRAQVEQLQRAVNQLTSGQQQTTADAKAAKQQADEAKAKAAQAAADTAKLQKATANANAAFIPAKAAAASDLEIDAQGHTFLQKKKGNPLTFYTPGGEVTGYGNFDVSIDATTKSVGDFGSGNFHINDASPPVGNFGWLPAIASNSSYLGVRGFQRLPNFPLNFIYRVEFSTRLEHSIWYESPTINGFQFNALFSPGQNRSNISDNIPAGSSDCAGGNDPLSGGLFPQGCNDGAFSNAVSTNLSYTNGGFYGTLAYERHFKVNRQSDISGIYGGCVVGQAFNDCVTQGFAQGMPGFFGNSTQLNAFLADVADEDAFKVAALYTFPTKTTVGGIFEIMHRYVSPLIQFQNERTRNGSWLFLTQELSPEDSVSFGWAHAFRAKGDPGQHNSDTTAIPLPGSSDPATCGNVCDGNTTASNNNQSDMVTATYKRKYGPNLTWYAAVAATFNGPNAHYDLGAGGHGVTTDCHDAFAASGGSFSQPHCFVGPTLAGVSTGIQWRF